MRVFRLLYAMGKGTAWLIFTLGFFLVEVIGFICSIGQTKKEE